MTDDQQVMAEREYQRCLEALHHARARLAELEAALHRLAIDRPRMSPQLAAQNEAALTSAWQQARAEVNAAHQRADIARAQVHHLTDYFDEPIVVSPNEEHEGYEQPPFQSGPGLGGVR